MTDTIEKEQKTKRVERCFGHGTKEHNRFRRLPLYFIIVSFVQNFYGPRVLCFVSRGRPVLCNTKWPPGTELVARLSLSCHLQGYNSVPFLTFYSKKMLLGLRASWKYRYMNIYSIDSRLIIVWSITLKWNESVRERFNWSITISISSWTSGRYFTWRKRYDNKMNPLKDCFSSLAQLPCASLYKEMDKQKTTRNNQTLNQHR